MMTKKSIALLVMFLACFTLSAQESQLPPFVSRLTAVTDDEGVVLSWQDSAETEGKYYVYVHSEEITDANFTDARLLSTVAPGVERYLDTPESEGPHYYAVLASDEEGQQYEFFVPYRNKTTRGVRYAGQVQTETQIMPIADITAQIKEEEVQLSFSATTGRDVVIYRSTGRLTSTRDLVDAVLLETGEYAGGLFIDKPMAGIPYYYGVFYDEALRTGSPAFTEGENVLITPVQLPLEETGQIVTVEPVRRVRPLPYLMLSSTIDSGEELKAGIYDTPSATASLSGETAAAVQRLLSDRERQGYGDMEPVWLSGKVESEMEKLLEEPFEQGKWEEALAVIQAYVRTRRTPVERQRAFFYEGQCLYFLGQYEEAFMKFIFAEEASYTNVQPWLNDIISLLASK